MLTILNNVVKDTETNPEVFEPSQVSAIGCHYCKTGMQVLV